jgi:predicted negative regulator of RcsB-dependent stress response
MDTNVSERDQDKQLASASELMLAAIASAIRLRDVEMDTMDVSEDGDHESQVAEARKDALLRLEEALSAITARPHPSK